MEGRLITEEGEEESFIPYGFFDEDENNIWKTPGLVWEGGKVQNELNLTKAEVK